MEGWGKVGGQGFGHGAVGCGGLVVMSGEALTRRSPGEGGVVGEGGVGGGEVCGGAFRGLGGGVWGEGAQGWGGVGG